jgi:hypothetical protein
MRNNCRIGSYTSDLVASNGVEWGKRGDVKTEPECMEWMMSPNLTHKVWMLTQENHKESLIR